MIAIFIAKYQLLQSFVSISSSAKASKIFITSIDQFMFELLRWRIINSTYLFT